MESFHSKGKDVSSEFYRSYRIDIFSITQLERQDLLLLVRPSKVRIDGSLNHHRLQLFLATRSVIIRLNQILSLGGLLQTELLRSVSLRDIIRDSTPDDSIAMFVITLLPIRIGHPKIYVTIIGVPCKDNPNIDRAVTHQTFVIG